MFFPRFFFIFFFPFNFENPLPIFSSSLGSLCFQKTLSSPLFCTASPSSSSSLLLLLLITQCGDAGRAHGALFIAVFLHRFLSDQNRQPLSPTPKSNHSSPTCIPICRYTAETEEHWSDNFGFWSECSNSTWAAISAWWKFR